MQELKERKIAFMYAFLSCSLLAFLIPVLALSQPMEMRYDTPVQLLLEHQELTRVDETLRYGGPENQNFTTVYTIDRAKREIHTQLPASDHGPVTHGITVFDEQWRKTAEYAYTANEELMYEYHHKYQADGKQEIQLKYASVQPDGQTLLWSSIHKIVHTDSSGLITNIYTTKTDAEGVTHTEQIYEYLYNKKGKLRQRIVLEKQDGQSKFTAVQRTDYKREQNKRITLHLDNNENSRTILHRWFANGRITRSRSRQQKRHRTIETIYVYEDNRLFSVKTLTKTPQADTDEWRFYTYY